MTTSERARKARRAIRKGTTKGERRHAVDLIDRVRAYRRELDK